MAVRRPGAAFLWVDPDVRGRLEPALTGWMAHQRPFAFERVARPPQRRLAATARDAEHPGSLRREARTADRSTRSGSTRFARSRSGRPSGCWTWPIAKDTRARRRATPRDAAAPSPSTSKTRTRYPRASRRSTSSATTAPGPASASRLTFYNLDSELDTAIEAIREIRSSGAWRAFTAGNSAVT